MKKLLMLAILATALLSCSTPKEEAEGMRASLTYFKDHSTGLCFAYYTAGCQGYLACVPCSKVEQHLVN